MSNFDDQYRGCDDFNEMRYPQNLNAIRFAWNNIIADCLVHDQQAAEFIPYLEYLAEKINSIESENDFKIVDKVKMSSDVSFFASMFERANCIGYSRELMHSGDRDQVIVLTCELKGPKEMEIPNLAGYDELIMVYDKEAEFKVDGNGEYPVGRIKLSVGGEMALLCLLEYFQTRIVINIKRVE